MRVDGVDNLSPEEKTARNSVVGFFENMYKVVETTNGIIDYPVADIARLRPYIIDDYTDDGSYNALTITPHSIFRNAVYSGETIMLSWEEVLNSLTKTKQDLISNKLSTDLFRTHYVLTNSNVRFALGTDHINFAPITKVDENYFTMLEEVSELNVFQARFVADLHLDKGLTLDEAIASIEMPKEWFTAMFENMVVKGEGD